MAWMKEMGVYGGQDGTLLGTIQSGVKLMFVLP